MKAERDSDVENDIDKQQDFQIHDTITKFSRSKLCDFFLFACSKCFLNKFSVKQRNLRKNRVSKTTIASESKINFCLITK